MLLPPSYPSNNLIEALDKSPFSKVAIKSYLDTTKACQVYMDRTLFNRLRRRVERIHGSHLDFRKRLDRAQFGRYIAWAELSIRNQLPSGWNPLYLEMGSPLKERESYTSTEVSNSKAPSFHPSLLQYEQFHHFLSLGKILPQAPRLNGMEQTPLFKVFGSPTTLSELKRNYRYLRRYHHPDQSPYPSQEASDRFSWLNKAYKVLVENWDKFDPTSTTISFERIKKLKSKEISYPEGWYIEKL